MNQIKELIGGFLGGLLGLCFLALFGLGSIYGIYHSFSKHNLGTGVISLIPPVAWYMAAEGLFWHDDFANVDWELRLKNDVKTIASLLGALPKGPTEVQEYNSAIEVFAKNLASYPPDKKKYLEKFGVHFIAYNESALNDVMSNFDEAMEKGSIEIKQSPKTLALEKTLLTYSGTEEFLGDSKLALYAFNEMVQGKNMQTLSETLGDTPQKILFLMNKKTLNKMVSAYFDIFGNPLPSNA